MIFYQKPKLYKNGNVRHGIVLIDGVKYNAEFVSVKQNEIELIYQFIPLLSKENQLPQPLMNEDDRHRKFEEVYNELGFIYIRYKDFVLKLTKIE